MLHAQLSTSRVPVFQRTSFNASVSRNRHSHDRAQRLYSAAAHELESSNQIGMGSYSNTPSEHVQDIASAEQVRQNRVLCGL